MTRRLFDHEDKVFQTTLTRRGGNKYEEELLHRSSTRIPFFVVVSAANAAPVDQQIQYSKKTTLTYPRTYTFRFSLWDDETLGTEVWSEEKAIRLTSATIKTRLGDSTPLEATDFSEQLWVQVERKKPDLSYVVLGKRDRLVSAPYALPGLSSFMRNVVFQVAASGWTQEYVDCGEGYHAISCSTYTSGSSQSITMSGYHWFDVVDFGEVPQQCFIAIRNDDPLPTTVHGYAVSVP